MKKTVTLLLARVLLMSVFAGCGSKEEVKEPVSADLTAFYNELSTAYEWIPEAMMDLAADKEMLEAFYPGLAAIPAKQLVVMTPMMSAVVNEIALVECETEADAAKEKKARDEWQTLVQQARQAEKEAANGDRPAGAGANML